MRFDPIGLNWPPYLEIRLSAAGWIVLSAYGLAVLWGLARTYRDFAGLRLKRAAVFALLLAAALLLAESLVVRLDGPPPLALPGQPRTPTNMGLPLLGALAMTAAATWLGTGPAVAVGLVTGLTWAAMETFRPGQAFEVALWALAMGAMLNQRYKGTTGAWLRHPIVAASLSAVAVAWPVALIGVAVSGPAEPLASLQYVTAVMWPMLLVYGGQGLLAGALAQAADAVLGELRPGHGRALVEPPWTQRLSRRILFTIVPLTVTGIVVLVGAVMFSAHRVATALVVDQMARDAANVSNNVPFFVQVGRGLIRDLAKDERLLSDEASTRQARLSEGLRAVPFFQQLIYFDVTSAPAAAYPDANVLELGLTPEEQSRVLSALGGGIPAETTVYRPETQQIFMSFVSPVNDPATGKPVGALLGRADLDDNPIIRPVVSVLSGVLVNSGEGFIVDERGRIILHPARPERQLQSFELSGATPVAAGDWPGQAFRQTEVDGTQQLVYLLPIAGHSNWSVVVTVPNEVVLAQAVEISLPILAILVLLAAVALPAGGSIARRLTEPLETLSEAAARITTGQLDQQVLVEGEDEVGRLGVAFEDMRLSLKSRLSEQSKLLDVSRRVSSSLELYRALPPILGAVLEVTDALGARIALRVPDGVQTYAAGQGAAGMAALDEQLADLVEHEGTVVVGQLWKAAGSIDTSRLSTPIKALLAVPLRSDTSFHGVLWLGYADEHPFEEPELTFVSTLAGQAAVAVANARLFEAAEGGRRRLAAILESTADAVLVTDRRGRLALMNPAAADFFGVQVELVQGREVAEVIDQPELIGLLTDPQEPTATLELPSRNDKTFYASVSAITGSDGVVAGRVAVLRDITYLKDLDKMKNLFVDTVIHDLRAPLTVMRVCAQMLPTDGALNKEQEALVERITGAVARTSGFVDDLLDIRRLESGGMLQRDACEVGDVVRKECEGFLVQAETKKIDLQVDLPADLPPIVADEALYSRAVGNLIDNAIKYTPEGGRVGVTAYAEGEYVVVKVQDNGIGIAPRYMENLFKPYFRVESPGGARPKGTGLGLALVKLIAERHHGSVRVESEEGKGSAFYLSLPLRQPEEG
jgi:PAS domain S-box-containing protein